jgi:hypothetical protein
MRAAPAARPAPAPRSMRGGARASWPRSHLQPWRCASRGRPMSQPSASAGLRLGQSAWSGQARRSSAPRGPSTRWPPQTGWWRGPWSGHGKRPERARSRSRRTLDVFWPRHRSRGPRVHVRPCAAARVICQPSGTPRRRRLQTARRLGGHWASVWWARGKGRGHTSLWRCMGSGATAPRRGAGVRWRAGSSEAIPRPGSPGPLPCLSKVCAGGPWPRGARPTGGARPSGARPVPRRWCAPCWGAKDGVQPRRGRAP